MDMEQAEQAHNEFVSKLEDEVAFLKDNCRTAWDTESYINTFANCNCIPHEYCKKLLFDTTNRMNSKQETNPLDQLVTNYSGLKAKFPVERQPIIDGMFRVKDVINIVSASKVGKSWFVMQMLYSVANGLSFLGHNTMKTSVCLIDNELHGDTLKARMEVSAGALGVDPDSITVLPIRGLRYDIHGLTDWMSKQKHGLIVVDAFYKILPKGTDENANADMSELYCVLDQITEASGAAVAIVHHTSKGTQKGKAATDLGSGAGSMARAVDLHFGIVRDDKNEGFYSVHSAVRSFKPIAQTSLKYEYPLWTVSNCQDATLTWCINNIGTESKQEKDIVKCSGMARGTVRDWLEDARKQGYVDSCVDSTSKTNRKPVVYFMTAKHRPNPIDGSSSSIEIQPVISPSAATTSELTE